jgi:hypothetical protein
MEPYKTIEELIAMIDAPNSDICKRFLQQNQKLLTAAKGSLHNHQWWEGGYRDHITEVMNIARLLYTPLHNVRQHPFSLSDALLVLFLHDIEKPWKYEKENNEWKTCSALDTKQKAQAFREEKIREYGFQLSGEHMQAVIYAEGELHNYSDKDRQMKPLAAFVHMCDVWSARGWFDQPHK